MAPEQDDDRGRQRRAEIAKSDKALTESKAETATSRLETAASRVETQASRVETQAAHDESKVDSAVVQGMIEEFTAKADEIAKASREAQDEWVAAVAQENVIFKQRNAVLVENNRTIIRMLKVCVPVLLLLLANAGYSQWRATYRTGPAITDTKHILTDTIKNKDSTIAARDETIADQEIVLRQAVEAITLICGQMVELGSSCPQIILDPDKVEAGATSDPVPADIEETP